MEAFLDFNVKRDQWRIQGAIGVRPLLCPDIGLTLSFRLALFQRGFPKTVQWWLSKSWVLQYLH